MALKRQRLEKDPVIGTSPLATSSLSACLELPEHVRRVGDLYSLEDVCLSAGIRAGAEKFIGQVAFELKEFPGGGESPAGSISVVCELLLSLPSCRTLRCEAAQLILRYQGGDSELGYELENNREDQETLRLAAPFHPLRAFGRELDKQPGRIFDKERRGMEELLLEYQFARDPSDDAQGMTDQDHQHKNDMTTKFIEVLRRTHGEDLSALSGDLVISDDLDQNGLPRTTTALVAAGVLPHRIIALSGQAAIVEKLVAMKVKIVREDRIYTILAEMRDLTNVSVSGAYLDSLAHDLGQIVCSLRHYRVGDCPMAYTIVKKPTPGGALQFLQKIMTMYGAMKLYAFEPQFGDVAQSYFEPSRTDGLRMGTHFWLHRS
jgi:hypothetical protein